MADGYMCRVCTSPGTEPIVFDMRPTRCPYCGAEESIVPINPDSLDLLDEAWLWLQRRKQDA